MWTDRANGNPDLTVQHELTGALKQKPGSRQNEIIVEVPGLHDCCMHLQCVSSLMYTHIESAARR